MRTHGRGQQGQRVVVRERHSGNNKRVSFIPLLSVRGMEYVKVLEGTGTAASFYEALETFVVTGCIQRYPAPRSVLVMDNARIHHNRAVRWLIEEHCGAKLVFLPPYSPHKNPIESAFSGIKQWFHRHYETSFEDVREAIVAGCYAITPEQAEGWFRLSGYL